MTSPTRRLAELTKTKSVHTGRSRASTAAAEADHDDREGYDRHNYDREGYDRHGYDRHGDNRSNDDTYDDDIRRALRTSLLERQIPRRGDASRLTTQELRDAASAVLASRWPLLDRRVAQSHVESVIAELTGLGPLDLVMYDETITDVFVNGPDCLWVERQGAIERVNVRFDTESIMRCLERILAPLGHRLDRLSPFVDARLPDGSRVHAVIPPLAVDGPVVTLRRFAPTRFPLEAFTDPQTAAYLRDAVRSRQTILVSGPTGSGKTSLLNALCGAIDSLDRIIAIEDTSELRLPNDHVVRLEARAALREGGGQVGLRELVRNALRMRPDRLVVGEVRGPEAFDLLQALNTGHRGGLSTLHANSCDDALRRFETMVLTAESGLPFVAVRRQIAAAVDLVVQVERADKGARRIVEVAEVIGSDEPSTNRLDLPCGASCVDSGGDRPC